MTINNGKNNINIKVEIKNGKNYIEMDDNLALKVYFKMKEKMLSDDIIDRAKLYLPNSPKNDDYHKYLQSVINKGKSFSKLVKEIDKKENNLLKEYYDETQCIDYLELAFDDTFNKINENKKKEN